MSLERGDRGHFYCRANWRAEDAGPPDETMGAAEGSTSHITETLGDAALIFIFVLFGQIGYHADEMPAKHDACCYSTKTKK